MWLVLCDSHDRAALWAYRRLLARNRHGVELVTPAQLVYAPWSVHRVGSPDPALEIVLADGREIVSTRVTGVLNRVISLPSIHLARVHPEDRAYAMEELSALVVSWLACLPNVVNPPHPLGLAGHARHRSEWTRLARAAGLGVGHRSSRLGPTDARAPSDVATLIVLDEEVFGQQPHPEVGEACMRLAALSDTPLLGITVNSGSDGSAEFLGATPTPDLRIGGEPLLDSLTMHWAVSEVTS